MTTEYYCADCDIYFSEDMLPNMHKLHRCGANARIIRHSPHEDPRNQGK